MKIIAHRGYSGAYPEQTAVAYENALALPIHGVECDIRLTRDGHVVCLHDAEISRVSDGSGMVSELSLEELRRVNFGTQDSPQRVLTLDELLDLLAPTDKHLYIETKHPQRWGRMLEEQLQMRLRYRGWDDNPRVHIISFSPVSLRRVRRLLPDLDRTMLYPDRNRLPLACGHRLSQPSQKGMSLARARLDPGAIRADARPTYLWTVNNEQDMRWAAEHGVEMLATDEPTVALRVLGS